MLTLSGGIHTVAVWQLSLERTHDLTLFDFYVLVMIVLLGSQNIMFAEASSVSAVRLVDFGLATICEDNDTMRTLCGTWARVSPLPLYPCLCVRVCECECECARLRLCGLATG